MRRDEPRRDEGVRTCVQCGVSIAGYRRQARYCGGPCRAAVSRARAAARSTTLMRRVEVGVDRETAQNRTTVPRGGLYGRTGSRTVEAQLGALHSRYADLLGMVA